MQPAPRPTAYCTRANLIVRGLIQRDPAGRLRRARRARGAAGEGRLTAMAGFKDLIGAHAPRQHGASGVRSLDVSCWNCHHRAITSADLWPDHVPVPTIGPRIVCTWCGIIGADARANVSLLQSSTPLPSRAITGRQDAHSVLLGSGVAFVCWQSCNEDRAEVLAGQRAARCHRQAFSRQTTT